MPNALRIFASVAALASIARVLGNEETMADAFATHFLIEHLPERAYDSIKDRVTSLMIEADDLVSIARVPGRWGCRRRFRSGQVAGYP